MLKEMSVTEQRYQAVPAVIAEGREMTDVAGQFDVQQEEIDLTDGAARHAEVKTIQRTERRLFDISAHRGQRLDEDVWRAPSPSSRSRENPGRHRFPRAERTRQSACLRKGWTPSARRSQAAS